MKPQPFGRRATLKAGLLVAVSTYVSFGLGLVVNAVAARSLGTDDFGRYAYVVWLSGLLVLIAVNGLSTTGIRFVSESLGRNESESARRVHGWLGWRLAASTLLVVAGFAAGLHWLLPAGWSLSPVEFAAVVVVSFAARTVYIFAISIAKGHGRFTVEAYSNVALSVASVLGVGALALSKAPLAAFLWLFGAVSVGYGLVSWGMSRRAGIRSASEAPEPALKGRLNEHLLWTVVLTLVAAFSNKTIETYLLNRLVGAAEVGFFAIASSLSRGGMELLTAGLTTVLMPAMAHAYGASGIERVHAMLGNSVRYFFFAGLVLAGVGVLWSDAAVSLLYGASYRPAIPVLQAMLVVAGLTLPQGALGAMLSTTDHQRTRATVAAISLGVSLVAAVVLVPRYGLAGAVVSHAASSLAVMAMVIVVMRRMLDVRLPWRLLGRMAGLAAGLFVVVGLPALLWSPHVVQAAAGIAYAAALVLGSIRLRAWSDEELVRLHALAARRRGLGWLARWARPPRER